MFDTARAIVSLILNVTLYRCPDIRSSSRTRWCLAFFYERLDHLIGGLDRNVLRGIERDNALALFPRFKP
jgi:hypothetical protein